MTILSQDNSPWLDTELAAQYIGFSPLTLRSYRSRGEGPPYHKIGRAVRYHRAELDDFIINSSQESVTKGGL